MAIMAGTVCEIRTTGSQNAGGGFYDRNPGTSVDYSQQDSPQLTLTDLATDGAGTGLSSATGGFTAAMQGNWIRIAGGTLTAGWYEITAYTDTNNVTIDRSAGLSKSGGSGYVGGAFKLGGSLDNDFISTLVAGNRCWIKSGAYTLGESISLPAGSATVGPIYFVGYKTTRGDTPVGADRPTISGGSSYRLTVGTFSRVYNIDISSGAGITVALLTEAAIFASKVTNTAASSAIAINIGSNDYCRVVQCEVIAANGTGVSTANTGSVCIVACYAHNSVTGFQLGRTSQIIGSIADTCTTGIEWGARSQVMNNVAYGCTSGFVLSEQDYASIVINNIADACQNSFVASEADDTYLTFNDYNCVNSTTEYTNFVAGAHDIDADPLLADPANGNFTLSTGSPCLGSGLCVGTAVGL